MFKAVFDNKRTKQAFPDNSEHNTFVDKPSEEVFIGCSPASVLWEVRKFYGIHEDTAEASVTPDAQGAVGRVEVTYMVDRNGYRADKQALRIWRQGRLDLWRTTLTGYLRCSWSYPGEVGKKVTKAEGDR